MTLCFICGAPSAQHHCISPPRHRALREGQAHITNQPEHCNSTKTATPVSIAQIHQLLKLLEEFPQTSVVTQLDHNENNAILLQGRLSP